MTFGRSKSSFLASPDTMTGTIAELVLAAICDGVAGNVVAFETFPRKIFVESGKSKWKTYLTIKKIEWNPPSFWQNQVILRLYSNIQSKSLNNTFLNIIEILSPSERSE